MRRVIFTLVATGTALVVASAQTPAGRQVVNDAAQALGGKDRIEAVKTLIIEGEASSWGAVGGVRPDGPQNLTKVTDYKQGIDVARERMRVTETRTLQFPFALATVTRQDLRLDGDLAFNVPAAGAAAAGRGGAPMPNRANAAVWRQRRADFLSHPIIAVRAALHPGAKLGDARTQAGQQLVDVTTVVGELFTLAVDASTKLPASVTWMTSDDNLGDIAIQTSFAQYEDVGGVKLPKQIVTKTDRWKTWELLVSKNTLDGDVGDLAAPDAVKTAPPPAAGPPPVLVTAEPVAKGIWYMGGTGEHSVLFEFADHLVLFETPGNDARTLAVIEKARATVPGKPLTMAITSHHHFDHAGGFRAAVSEGLTMVMYKDNVALFKDVASRPHTIDPDALAKRPKPLKVQAVDDKLTLKDNTMEVILYHVKGDVHADTELMAWVPRDRLLVEADQFDKAWTQYPWGSNFIQNVEQRKLNVDRILPVHGMGLEPWMEVVATIRSKPATASPSR